MEIEDPQKKFDEDYLYLRREMVRGRNPFVTAGAMKDWMQARAEQVTRDINTKIEKRTMSLLKRRADRDLEFFRDLPIGRKDDGE